MNRLNNSEENNKITDKNSCLKGYTTKKSSIKSIFTIRYFMMFHITIFIILCASRPTESRKIISNSSSIYITINSIGNHPVFSPDKCGNNNFIQPDAIYINGILNESISPYYDLDKEKNNITLFWNDEINSTACLFKQCKTINEIDFSNFNSSKLKYTHGMFWYCESLISIKFSNFDTSKVIDMHYMFARCISIKNLNLSNFDTSLVTHFGNMFSQCNSLISLDISNFNTANAILMFYMFQDCYSLTSLDLSNFDTSSVTKTHNMFENCISLSILNLSNFKTSNVEHMGFMFSNCSSLVSLDLSNFDTSKANYMSHMFYCCEKLEYINLNNSKTKENAKFDQIFSGTTKNLVVCIQSDEFPNVEIPECSIIDCGDNWRKRQKKLYNDTCYDNCSSINFYDYNYKCYETCPNGTYNNNYICEKCDTNCLSCANKNRCFLCEEGYYNYYIDDNHSFCDEFKDGYYVDSKDNLYKPCYSTCKKCETSGNSLEHNCTECKDKYPLEILMSPYKNCLENNINETNEIYESYGINETKIISIDEAIKNFQHEITKNFKISLVGKKITLMNDTKNISYILTTTSEQKKNENKNETTIDLGLCENELKDNYNISYNDSLYILKIDVNETGMKIPKIEYEVYYLINKTNLINLNLSFCKNIKIVLSIPVYLVDDIEKHNASSDYYNDICSKTTSKYGTDICLKDRKDEFIGNNMTLCEENCELIDYNYDTKKAKCSCKIKLHLPIIENIEIDKNRLYKSFADINYFANINMIKCFKTIFGKNHILKNIGFFIFDSIIIAYFVILILFLYKYYWILKNQILIIVEAKKALEEKSKKEKDSRKNNNIDKKTNDKIGLKDKNNNNKYNYEDKKEAKIGKKKSKKKKTSKKSMKYKRKINESKTLPSKGLNYYTVNINLLENSKTLDNSKIGIKTEKINIEDVLSYNDSEINSLPYKQALEIDKREYTQYYYSLLKTNHLFLFVFCNDKDYNSKVIKILLFIFTFSVQLTVNALFFNDETMHKIYIDKGKFDFIYQLPQIIYSMLISIVINMIIKKLALSEKSVLEVKKIKKINELEMEKDRLLTILKVKFIIFFILSLIFLSVFSIFVTCFCGVYKNTQMHLIKDSIIGFITSLIYPFGIYLIPGLFRINALRAPKKNKRRMYKFSQLLQLI